MYIASGKVKIVWCSVQIFFLVGVVQNVCWRIIGATATLFVSVVLRFHGFPGRSVFAWRIVYRVLLPDLKNFAMSGNREELLNSIKEQGDLVRQLKAAKEPKERVIFSLTFPLCIFHEFFHESFR